MRVHHNIGIIIAFFVIVYCKGIIIPLLYNSILQDGNNYSWTMTVYYKMGIIIV